MIKRPVLYLVEGSRSTEERSIYRLRGTREQQAPAQEAWPKSGEWRQLIRRLMRKPVKGD